MSAQPRIGVVGATGAVGTVTLALLAERGYENVRAFASARSAGSTVPFGDAALVVEEATAETLGAGDVDLFLFSVGTSASRQLVPVASAAGAICIDKSSAYRLVDGYPLVVPEVNGRRALESLEHDRIVANPNCCTIPLTCVLKPLHDEAGLRRVRVSTYQSVSGAGAQRMDALAGEAPADHDVVMDWTWEGDESDEEAKLRAETRKILELPDLPISATCVRVPVMVGHSEAVWIELEQPLAPEDAAELLRGAPERPRPRPPRLPHAGRRRRRGRGARRQDPARPGRGERPRALPLERQPAQGRRAERDPDRGAVAERRPGDGEPQTRRRCRNSVSAPLRGGCFRPSPPHPLNPPAAGGAAERRSRTLRTRQHRLHPAHCARSGSALERSARVVGQPSSSACARRSRRRTRNSVPARRGVRTITGTVSNTAFSEGRNCWSTKRSSPLNLGEINGKSRKRPRPSSDNAKAPAPHMAFRADGMRFLAR